MSGAMEVQQRYSQMGFDSLESCLGSSLWSELSLERNEEEDFVSGLAEQMAHSMLDDPEDNLASTYKRMQIFASDLLPEKTHMSNNEWGASPKQAVKGSVTYSGFEEQEEEAWGLIHAAAARDMVRLKMEAWQDCCRRQAAPAMQPQSAPLFANRSCSTRINPASKEKSQIYAQQNVRTRDCEQKFFSNQQQYGTMEEENIWGNRRGRPQHQNHNRYVGSNNRVIHNRLVGHRPPQHPAAPLPHWQFASSGHAAGSGMRAIFLRGANSGRESSGTGVFLPQCAGSNHEKKKTSCSTVLLPSRIVQVLNLNVDDIRSPVSPVSPSDFAYPENIAGAEDWRTPKWQDHPLTCSQLRQQPSPVQNLPTEWTY